MFRSSVNFFIFFFVMVLFPKLISWPWTYFKILSELMSRVTVMHILPNVPKMSLSVPKKIISSTKLFNFPQLMLREMRGDGTRVTWNSSENVDPI